jgi:4-phospho-D-threonate 3-dehydrogenase / 4-phospho-D-erythronate 3-dehydrogenase
MVNTHLFAPQRKHPLFALSMGDPAGIGPEIACKVLKKPSFSDRVVVVGDYDVMERTAGRFGIPVHFNRITGMEDYRPGVANVLDCRAIDTSSFVIGKAQSSCGKASYTYITRSIDYALKGAVDGVITNPISKESLHAAGINYPGHTEIFAEQTGTERFSMLFLLRNVVVAHVTTHCSLRQALDLITAERIVSHIYLLHDALQRLGIASPRIAVSGLNPHAGENGLFGNEESECIVPAIKKVCLKGVDATGPYPPDTVFMRAFKGEFDGVVAMLHDHGFVALKSMDFEHGVNITIGLPIIRTSVGHGTAFDIAGQGKASPESLLAAFDAACRLYHNSRS